MAPWRPSRLIRLFTNFQHSDILFLMSDPLPFFATYFVDIPMQSLVQIILTNLPIDEVRSLRIEEQTLTPGRMGNLGLYETTRLRAIGDIRGKAVDLTDLNIVWESSRPDSLRVDQGGLVQRMRDSRSEITVEARTPGGAVSVAGLT